MPGAFAISGHAVAFPSQGSDKTLSVDHCTSVSCRPPQLFCVFGARCCGCWWLVPLTRTNPSGSQAEATCIGDHLHSPCPASRPSRAQGGGPRASASLASGLHPLFGFCLVGTRGPVGALPWFRGCGSLLACPCRSHFTGSHFQSST